MRLNSKFGEFRSESEEGYQTKRNDMKKILISDDKTVTKIVHDDNSETAIKTVSSCDTCITEDGEFILNETDRNKYSVFLSDSTGCFMKCIFCYLTLKDMKYRKIKPEVILNNFIEAILARIDLTNENELFVRKKIPAISNKYIKICWMGMGDAFINAKHVKRLTDEMLLRVSVAGYTTGLDGVDLSTVIPKVKNIKEIFNHLKELDELLQKYDLNPHNDVIVHRNADLSNTGTTYPDRSRFRLFYSLHSAIQETRDKLIPNAMPIDEAIPALIEYSENNKYNVIFHHMFIDGFNDTEKEIDALIDLINHYNLQNYELRILRYNTCEVATFLHESNQFKDIIKRLIAVHPHVKVQVSAGSEIKAACGQFLANN